MDQKAPEIVRSLHRQGYMTRKYPSVPITRWEPRIKMHVVVKWISEEDSGRGDEAVMKNGKSAYLEIKNADESFDLRDWREDQREWAVRYCISEPYNTPYFIGLIMGPDRVNALPENGYRPKRCWIIDYDHFITVDKMVQEHQFSLPYQVRKGMNKKMQALKLDAVTLFADYELEWRDLGDEKGGGWYIPETHVFHHIFHTNKDWRNIIKEWKHGNRLQKAG